MVPLLTHKQPAVQTLLHNMESVKKCGIIKIILQEIFMKFYIQKILTHIMLILLLK